MRLYEYIDDTLPLENVVSESHPSPGYVLRVFVRQK